MDELMVGFATRLAEEKDEFQRQCKITKRADFWKGVVHGHSMCDLASPRRLSYRATGRSGAMESGRWRPYLSPSHRCGDSEEEDLEANFPDYSPLLSIFFLW